jgi:hypothetical protein
MVMAASGSGLTSAQKALIAGAEQVIHKDQNSGYPGISSTGEVVCTLIGRHGTRAALLTQIPKVGELCTTDDTHQIYIGDNTTPGGVAPFTPPPTFTLDTQSALWVDGGGTPNQNGDALHTKYTSAKALTPYGLPISPANPVNILCEPGTYQPTTQLMFDTSGINIIGLGGSRNTFFVNTSNVINFHHNNAGMVLGGITFRMAAGIPLRFSQLPLTLAGANYHFDLVFDTGGSTTVNCMNYDSGGGTIFGTYRRIFTLGKNLYGGQSGTIVDATTIFDDCECGDNSLGSAVTVALPNVFNGTVRNCRYNGLIWAVRLGVTALIERNNFNGCGILRFAAASSGQRIVYNRILPASGTCIGNNTDTASVIATHNNLRTFGGATPFGTNITNLITTPYNVQDNNL